MRSVPYLTSSDISRFWSKVQKSPDPDACWIWRGTFLTTGYGQFSLKCRDDKRHSIVAHRIAYLITYGEIPDGLLACHKCDVPACVNPAHIFLGTCADNAADMVKKGRQAKGERHGFALHPERRARGLRHGSYTKPDRTRFLGSKNAQSKLKETDVVRIRAEYATGNISQQQLADQYHVSQAVISSLLRRKTWRCVP